MQILSFLIIYAASYVADLSTKVSNEPLSCDKKKNLRSSIAKKPFASKKKKLKSTVIKRDILSDTISIDESST